MADTRDQHLKVEDFIGESEDIERTAIVVTCLPWCPLDSPGRFEVIRTLVETPG